MGVDQLTTGGDVDNPDVTTLSTDALLNYDDLRSAT